MGRGSGRGSSGVGPGGRLADDGKRLDEVRVALGVVVRRGAKKISLIGEGSGEGRAIIAAGPRLADFFPLDPPGQ